MQLFILDRNPHRAVKMLADVHIRKMCLETAQILSSLLVRNGILPDDDMPKVYNINHPVIKALDTPSKVNYAVLYNIALQYEFLYRFGKKHKYFELGNRYFKKLFTPCAEYCDFSFCRDFKNCQIKTPDIIDAYREYYLFKKSIIRNWHYTKRHEPDFLLR